ncbi:hypothetical protein AY599_27010 [Leptolyngbya valderiana BDU 20041]|nr:hypothetical protein AY599_27010 [Leptolyngbya valderiana BDU 20041]
MKVAEAVGHSGLSRAHIYRLINDGTVPSETRGKVRFVDAEALRHFVEDSAARPRRGRKPGTAAAKSTRAARTKSAAGARGGRSAQAPNAASRKGRPPTRPAQAAPGPVPSAAERDAELLFLRREVERLWGELESRRREQLSERERLLKMIEQLARK